MTAARKDVRLVLQAGGFGRRMGDTALDTPKPLLAVCGVPMIERLLRQAVDSGIRAVTVVTGWLGGRIEDHVRSLGGLPGDLEVAFIREAEPRGNVGALAELPRDGRKILLSFADLVTDLDFGELLAVHDSRGADITLASHLEAHRLALGEIVAEDSRVTGYLEKPEKLFLICSGIVVLTPPAIALVSRDRPIGISDLVVGAIAHGLAVTHWTHGAFWMDVNSPAELERAGAALAARRS